MGDIGRPYRYVPFRGLSPIGEGPPWYLPAVWQFACAIRSNTGITTLNQPGKPVPFLSATPSTATLTWDVSEEDDLWGDVSCLLLLRSVTGRSMWEPRLDFVFDNPFEPVLNGHGVAQSEAGPTTIPFGPTGPVAIEWDNPLTALLLYDVDWSILPLPGY